MSNGTTPLCLPAPSLTNGLVAASSTDNSTATATYTCTSGYYLTGNSPIYCNESLGVWDTLPVCNLILQGASIANNIHSTYTNSQDVNVEVETWQKWWFFVIIGVLALLGLLILALLVCCCCWWCKAPFAIVGPAPMEDFGYTKYHSRGHLSHRGRCCFCSRGRKVDEEVKATGEKSENIFWATQGKSHNADGLPSVEHPPRDTQLYRMQKVAKEPMKDRETKIWMPHSHHVRNINTSTK